jgi:hypothetical protein
MLEKLRVAEPAPGRVGEVAGKESVTSGVTSLSFLQPANADNTSRRTLHLRKKAVIFIYLQK